MNAQKINPQDFVNWLDGCHQINYHKEGEKELNLVLVNTVPMIQVKASKATLQFFKFSQTLEAIQYYENYES